MDSQDYTMMQPPRPLCANRTFICPEYFSVENSLFIAYIIARIGILLFILLLAVKVPKDFLKTFIVALFLPMLVGEFFYLATEIVFYASHFYYADLKRGLMKNAATFGHNLIGTFAFYTFLAKSLVVVFGSWYAWFSPVQFRRFKLGVYFNAMLSIPLTITILSYVPFSQSTEYQNAIAITRCVLTIVLGSIMGILYIMTLIALPCKAKEEVMNDAELVIREAKSRLNWFTVFMTVQNIVNIPAYVLSFTTLIAGSNIVILTEQAFMEVHGSSKVLADAADAFRPLIIALCTVLFIPGFRRTLLRRAAKTVMKQRVTSVEALKNGA